MGVLNAGNAGELPPLPKESPFQPGAGTAPPALGGRRAEREALLRFASQTALAQALSSRGREAVTTTTTEGGLETRAGLPGILDIKGGNLVYTAKQTEWRELTTDEVLQDRTLGADGDARALLVILDELHEVPTQCADAPGLDPLGDFLYAIQNADAVLLAMASTPDAEDRLAQAGATFVGCMVKPHGWLPLARLELEDAMQALFQPFAELGRRPLGAADENWGGELAAAAYGTCSGHPHFIQLLGDALFQEMRQSSPNSPIIGLDTFE